MLNAALIVAHTGLPVFPCGLDKAPLTARGFKDATTDPETIRAWSWKDATIGAAIPQGLVVLDVDPRNGGDATLALFPNVPATRTARTRSGGRHYWLVVPPDLALRGSLGPGVDIKRAGKGYVIVPPSPGYAWIRGGRPAYAPAWLLEELIVVAQALPDEARGPKFFPFEYGTPYGLAALRNAVEALGNAPEGARNDALNRAAFAMGQLEAGGEIGRDHAAGTLLDQALVIGLRKDEAMKTIESGWLAGGQVPRQAPKRGATA